MLKLKPNEIIPLEVDLLFKKVFGDNDCIERLEGFISAYFNVPYEEVKGNVQVINGERRIRNKDSKRQYYDVVASVMLSSGNIRLNIEVNLKRGTTLERNILYATNMLSGELKNKEDYSNIEPVIQINFDGFEINEKNDRLVKRCYIKDETNTIISNILEIDHINIDKCKCAWYNNDVESFEERDRNLIRIGALLTMTNMRDFEACLEEISMNKDIKEDIKDTVCGFSEEEEMLLYYDKEKNDEAIRRGDISLARKEGIKQGIIEGVNRRNIEIARNMLNKNLDIDMISEVTGLTKEEIEKLDDR